MEQVLAFFAEFLSCEITLCIVMQLHVLLWESYVMGNV